LDPVDVPDDFVDDHGQVDVEVLASDGAVMTTRFVTVRFIKSATDAAAAQQGLPSQALPLVGSWVAGADASVPAALSIELVDLGVVRDDSILEKTTLLSRVWERRRSWRLRSPSALVVLRPHAELTSAAHAMTRTSTSWRSSGLGT
jgi:hypothetical protein